MKSSYKIIIIGDSGVGKTSLMRRYVNHNFSEIYKSTIGVDFLCKTLKINNKLIDLQIWDTAGSERFYSMNNAFYRGADACIVVFDVTNINSFMSLENWIDEFLINASLKEPESFPFVIIGNKADLYKERRVNSNMISRFCSTKNIIYFETSSKLNVNVEDAFEYLIDKMYQNDTKMNLSYDLDSINLENEENEQNLNKKINLNNKDKYNYCYCF